VSFANSRTALLSSIRRFPWPRGGFAAIALSRNWPPDSDVSSLLGIGYGSFHDRLDAYLSAWVASLDDCDRLALGKPPNDAIWIPRLTSDGEAISIGDFEAHEDDNAGSCQVFCCVASLLRAQRLRSSVLSSVSVRNSGQRDAGFSLLAPASV
jgi:hypothetical protein